LNRRSSWLALVVVLLAAGAALISRLARPAGDARNSGVTTSRRDVVNVASGTTLAIGRGPSIALSPDGRRLVYVGTSSGRTQLYVRELGGGDPAPVAGTDGASDPFFSPDGQWLGFIADQKLRKIPTAGGGAVMLADVPAARGLTWADADRIVVVPRDNTGLWHVSAQGGKLEPLTTLADGDVSHRWPQVLPGGKAVVYTIWGGEWDQARIAVQPLDGGARKIVVNGGGFGRFVGDEQSGFLVYVEGDSLMAVPFDPARLAIAGKPIAAADGAIKNNSGGVHAAVSASGSLAYLPEGGNQTDRELVWVDRHGAASPAAKVHGFARRYDLSPDGSRVVRYNVEAQTGDVWIDDLATGKATRVTFHADPMPPSRALTDRLNAVWAADGTHVAYAAGSPTNLYLADVGNGRQPERLTTSSNTQWPTSWSHDGKTLAYVEQDPLSGSDIWLLSQDRAGTLANPRPFLRTPFSESVPTLSPDGRWVAYHSNESGRYEIYVQPWPDGGRRWQVSTDGGALPRWSPRGDEVFFRSGPARTAMAAVAVKAEPEFTPAPPTVLFDLRGYDSPFSVAPDAQRFLLLRLRAPDATTQVTVVVNWLDELRRHPR
jgi:eukaryotic-like serine/threonine-protein kinase